VNESWVTHEGRGGGNQSVTQTGNAELTEKLCQCVMVLIWWKVGTNKVMSEHVVWVLEEWLQRRGLSIYTDLV
jgi:hypothetical protein